MTRDRLAEIEARLRAVQALGCAAGTLDDIRQSFKGEHGWHDDAADFHANAYGDIAELLVVAKGQMSNLKVGGEQLTWQEAAEHWHEVYRREARLAGVLADLDRCEHGRHEGDDCGSCGGPSHGNPHLQAVMGYDLSATPIVMPDNARDRRNPDAWYARAADLEDPGGTA